MTSSAASAAGPTTPPDEPFDSIDLRQYVLAIWASRMWIVVCGVALALVSVAVGVMMPDEFEAQAVLAITRSKLNDPSEPPPTTASFRPFIENHSVAAQVVSDLNLGAEPHSVSPSRFFGQVVSVEEVRNSSVVILRATLGDPTLAAKAANRVAELAIESTRRLREEEAGRSREDLRQQRDDARKRVEDAEASLRAHREESQTEALKKDIDAKLEMREKVLPLLIDIEAARARLARAQTELGARPRVEVQSRTIDSDPMLLEGARALSTATGATLLGLQTRNEYANPTYASMDELVAKTQADLAAMERQKKEMVDVRKLDAPRLTELTRLYEAEAKLSQLETESELAKEVYLEVAKAYETARLQVSARSALLQLIGAAVTPDQPASRHLIRNALGAFLIGASLAAVAVLGYRALATGLRDR